MVAKWYPCEARLQHTLLMLLKVFEGDCGDFIKLGKEAPTCRAKDEAYLMVEDVWPLYHWHLQLTREGTLTVYCLIKL